MIKSTISDLLKTIISTFFFFASNAPLTFVVLICVSFLLFAVTNITGGNMSFNSLGISIFEWFGTFSDGSFNASDVMLIFFRLTFFGAIIGSFFTFIFKHYFGEKWNGGFFSSFKFILLIITTLFVFAFISAFSSQAVTGARDVVYVLGLFWVIAVIAFGLYRILNSIANMIMQSTTKIIEK